MPLGSRDFRTALNRLRSFKIASVGGALAATLCGAAVLFLSNIEQPRNPNFDEFHYVPAAKRILARAENTNWEHPPLAKLFMATSIAILGDRPLGWRAASVVSGLATLGGIYALARVLGLIPWAAWGILILAVFNSWIFVQARIGMLDTPMAAFVIWGMVFWVRSARPGERSVKANILTAGVLWGLACACKWFGCIAIGWAIASMATVFLFRSWRVRFESASPQDWYSAEIWKGWSPLRILRLLLIPAVGVYFATFIPLWGLPGGWRTPGELITAQKTMYEGQLRVVNSHPYMSTWSQWWVPTRPIWYAFEREAGAIGGADGVRGVFLLGNPWVQWLGTLALLWGIWRVWRERDRAWMWILSAYTAFYFSYLVIPRKVFFYFYYYPAALLFPLAVGLLLRDLATRLRWKRRMQQTIWGVAIAGAAGFFIYFYPILSAQLIPADAFREWMWLSSWI